MAGMCIAGFVHVAIHCSCMPSLHTMRTVLTSRKVGMWLPATQTGVSFQADARVRAT